MMTVASKNHRLLLESKMPPMNPKINCIPINIAVRENNLVATSSVEFQDSPSESIAPFPSNIMNNGNNPSRPYK